ncbi:PREDICTED: SH3 and cysteine-rich domain-containing protein 2-like [Condylura cristata]|uniref:SH3 and cysteine-rich domain-containing protein 2-like n=1 Tax=Condylura cristata TaxID=143302 RepID=UPI0006435274|nr:PREDICTED: SH3 and cysteine-rich domain-containing protein 2-like [Condylura cristata]
MRPGGPAAGASNQLGGRARPRSTRAASAQPAAAIAPRDCAALAQAEELTASLHSFKNKAFKKAKVCAVCKQIIDGQGISCRACKYSCHKKCEAKVLEVSTLPTSLCCNKTSR